jgi:arylsulfatase A-like enzyme
MPDLPDTPTVTDWMRTTGTTNFTPELAEHMARHYYGMVSLVDQKIGDLLTVLSERGLDQNPWMIYASWNAVSNQSAHHSHAFSVSV